MKIRELRKKRKLTQEDLSALTGLHKVLICNHETGLKKPSMDSLKKYADALKVTLDELIS